MHHFYSWMPLNEILQPQQLETLFVFVNRADKLSLVAFDCLNEIMSRNYVPAVRFNFQPPSLRRLSLVRSFSSSAF